MRKVLALLALIIVVFAAGTAMAAEPIKIGYLAALTGDYAQYGITEVNMAKLVVGDINAKGGILGRKIELIPYDTKTRNEDAVNAVRRMIESDKVCAIVGANSSGINIATAPIVAKGKTPQISTVGTNPFVTVDNKGKVRPYSFRICFTDPYQGALAADLAYNDLKKTKAAILYNVGSDYAQGLREFFVKDYEKLGGKIVADEGFRETDVDFRAQLTTIKNSGADLLFLPGMGKDMALAIKQAQELGLKVTIIGGDGYAEFMNEIAGPAMKGTFWVNHTYLDDPEMAPIFARYKEVYKDDCKEFVNGTMAYDAMYWLIDAIKRAGKADGQAIAKALEETKGLKLHHATLTIDPATHNPINKAGIILKVGDDLKTKFYKKVEPK
ncbi:ABC transporter substrate-binding protein [Cloacibacillus porcorum]|uniref:ABC transporter substrate-binding protein n=1 Tax=Cloacibacillus porcorum TaxID=1197717 RepID=A0A1B2I7D0_9BACT|nr:ABC transporter substrate-binding protein [Cloacibacillus porcorum]ANZ45881.1 ABC transporter substrate-binding protein [Cloacibacillus porcorum]MDD7648570.1 ABC transporter substrate-binding protein [Cloacibacillus porcorum]MDY4092960.1 ABC transporter substrate-binding protein [Cloacibacillus porcorum]